MRSKILSTGSYLPEKILTNKELESMVDTTDEWIVQRSGIHERHIAADDETTAMMGTQAAAAALEAAGLTGADIDGIIVATSTPDHSFPSVAVKIQAKLGVKTGPAYDVQAVCSGFIYALSTADAMIKAGHGQRFLVVGAEKFSALLDWSDRTTCVLFGDGAGAVILEATKDDTTGILSSHLHADGRQHDLLYVDGGPSSKTCGTIKMQGREVFKFAVNSMSGIVSEALEANGMNADDIDWLVPHQANIRIIEATAEKLNMPMEQVIVTVQKHGNTSAASIPLALDDAVRNEKIKRGDLILFEALGGGLTWGAALARF